MAAEAFHFPKSGNLMAGAYDPDTQELSITFRSGETYAYRSVPQGIVAGLKAAGSAGEYFARQIRPRFAGTKL